MTCMRCDSENIGVFKAEIAVRVPGLKNIDVPPVFIFPSVTVCLECGAANFDVPEEELRALLKRNSAAAG